MYLFIFWLIDYVRMYVCIYLLFIYLLSIYIFIFHLIIYSSTHSFIHCTHKYGEIHANDEK